MRSLSRKEASVIQTLLAEIPGFEADRMAASPVSRSGYMYVRQKAFEGGWLKLRYVPEFRLARADRILVTMARPYAERWREAIAALRAQPGTVFLSASPEVSLSVRWLRPEDEDAPAGAPDLDALLSQRWTVRASPPRSSVPVYFDFEGAWARWVPLGAPISYPWPQRSQGPDGGRGPGAAPPEAHLKAARAILASPEPIEMGEDGRPNFAPANLRPAQRSLLAERWLLRRFVPDFRRMPPVEERRVEEFQFVTGRFRPGRDGDSLLAGLFGRAGLAPFLFAFDGQRALFGLLAPRPAGTLPAGTEPALTVLKEFLERIDVGIQRVQSTVYPVDHHYGCLFG